MKAQGSLSSYCIPFIFIMGLLFFGSMLTSCQPPRSDNPTESMVDLKLEQFINGIKAVDNHAHVNTIDTNDRGADALPLELIFPFEIPERLRPGSPDWLSAYQGLYKYSGSALSDDKMIELISMVEKVQREKAEKFPEWVLDQIGTEVMLANRLAMGPGLSSPRFRWVSYVDALLYPLSTKKEAATTPEREKLFPLEEQHLKDFLSGLKLAKIPSTLDEYLNQVISATLASQKNNGCVAIKFELAFLRSLHFDEASRETAAQVYARYVNGGEPSRADYKILQDFLFRYIARKAGDLGMAVHIHVFPGPGNYYEAAGSDPLLLESVFNDSSLRNTKFVLIHGGGAFYDHTSMMLWKPNVYADISALTRLWSPNYLAVVLKNWLSQFPEKILFGSDASSLGPGLGWELGAWIATVSGRKAVAIALSDMIRNNEVNRIRAQEIAAMVMRTNAGNLYHLGLK